MILKTEMKHWFNSRVGGFPWITLLLFIVFELICFHLNRTIILIPVILLTLFPLILIYGNRKNESIISSLIYCFVVLQFLSHSFLPITEISAFLMICLIPLLAANQKFIVNRKLFPYIIPILLLLTGLSTSYIFQNINGVENVFRNSFFDLMIIMGIAVFLFIYYILSAGIISVNKLLDSIILSGLVFTAYVSLLVFKDNSLSSVMNSRFGSGTGFNPNLIASYLDLIFPICLFRGTGMPNKKMKFLYYFAALLVCMVILLTSSRGSLPGLFIIVLFYIWMKKSLSLAITCSVIAILAVFLFGNYLILRLLSPTLMDLLSDAGRLELAKSAFGILKENLFVFGIGMNSFSEMKFQFGFPQWFDPNRVMSSHNLFLEFWLGWGIFGIVGWLGLFGFSLYDLSFKASKKIKACNYAILFSLLSFFVHGFFDSVVANFSVMFNVFALLASAAYITQNEHYNQKTVVGMDQRQSEQNQLSINEGSRSVLL